jgi:hypothetical protein
MSFASWIREDESLHPLLVDSYEDLIQFSSLPTLNHTETAAHHSIEMKERILRILFQSSHDDEGCAKTAALSASKCVGSVGFVLLIRSISLPPSGNASGHQVLLLKETFIDPFLSTLDCVLAILGDETVSDRLTSVAICAVPQIHSVLIALLDAIQRSLSGEEQVTDETQQHILLGSIASEFLFALLTSSRNQMMESLQIVAMSNDPAAGEYLRVSQNGWRHLTSRISRLLKLKDGAKSLSRNERVNYQNLVERLGSLDEIFRNLFPN